MRRLIQAAYEHPTLTGIFFTAMVLAGVFSFHNMPRREDPEVSVPYAIVVTVYPGASAEKVERLITGPIEDAAYNIGDIKKLDSYSRTGVSVVVIQIHLGCDIDEHWRRLRREIADVELPENALSPEITAEDLIDVGTVTLALAAPEGSEQDTVAPMLARLSDPIEKRLKKVAGVERVEVTGYPEEEVKVDVDLKKISMRRLPFTRIPGAIMAADARIPGGDLKLAGTRFPVEISSQFETEEQVKNVIVDMSDTGSPVRVGDVALVKKGPEESSVRARWMGRRAVLLTAFMQDGVDVTRLGRRLREMRSDIARNLPDGYTLAVAADQGRRVQKRISGFMFSMLQGFLLVVMVIALTLGLRGTVAVAVALPLSILMAFAGMSVFNIELQQVSIAALILAVGMLVDNSIVITENVHRHLRLGESKMSAAVNGAGEVWGSILSSTLTTMVAFIPLAFMGGMTGTFIRSIPIVICLCLASSYLVAMLLSPSLGARLLKPSGGLVLKFDRKLMPGYERLLKWTLNHPLRTLVGAFVLIAISVASVRFMDVQFFPAAEVNEFIIDIAGPPDANVDKTESVVRKVEKVLSVHQGVDQFTASVGQSMPKFYYNVETVSADEAFAQFLVHSKHGGESTAGVVADLKKLMPDVPGYRISVQQLEQGPPVGAPVVARLSGQKIALLRKAARQIKARLEGLPEVEQIYDDYGDDIPRVSVEVDEVHAARAGITNMDIMRQLRLAVSGVSAAELREGDDEIPVVVRVLEDQRGDFNALKSLYLDTAGGKSTPLGQFARIVPDFTLARVIHLDRERTVSVKIWGRDTSALMLEKAVRERISDYELPDGVELSYGGETEERDESFSNLGSLAVVAIMAVLFILVSQYRSLRHAFVIITALPFSVVGGVLGLWITHSPIGFMALVGLVSLIGVVVNGSIVLLEFIEMRRREGIDLEQAVVDAGKVRFRPIILTTVTTVGGLVPLTFFSTNLWMPMGSVVIFGLLVSTVLTLIVVPVLFTQVEKAYERTVEKLSAGK